VKRFFVELALGKDFELTDAEHNHLANVLRVKTGEHVTVCCGDAFDYRYEVTKITKNASSMRFIERKENFSNPKVWVSVFLAKIKFDNLALAVTKLNEIGASEVVIFNAANCNVALKSVNVEKLNIIAQQSCKQCGRSIPLKVRITTDEPDVALRGFDTVFFADELRENELALLSVQEISATDKNAVIIGPEGGFTLNERNKLLRVAKPVSLGRRILRAETAAIVSAAILLSKMGEL